MALPLTNLVRRSLYLSFGARTESRKKVEKKGSQCNTCTQHSTAHRTIAAAPFVVRVATNKVPNPPAAPPPFRSFSLLLLILFLHQFSHDGFVFVVVVPALVLCYIAAAA